MIRLFKKKKRKKWKKIICSKQPYRYYKMIFLLIKNKKTIDGKWGACYIIKAVD